VICHCEYQLSSEASPPFMFYLFSYTCPLKQDSYFLITEIAFPTD
jgi:hypothetical protein